MGLFFFLLLTMLAWIGLGNRPGDGALLIGLLLGLALWRLFRLRSRRPFGPLRALRLGGQGLLLLAVFVWEILVANLRQLRIVLAPSIAVSPYWRSYPTELETPGMRAVLGMMIVLTPGTVAYGEFRDAEGRWCIGVHGLHAAGEEEAAAAMAHIRRRLERPLRRMELL